MSIFRSLTLSRRLMVIWAALVGLGAFSSQVYGADWVSVGSNEYGTGYYQQSSVKIDKQNNIIKVLMKDVYTDKGKIKFLSTESNIDKQKLNDIGYLIASLSLDYRGWKFSLNQTTYYSKLDRVLSDDKHQTKWEKIKPNSKLDNLLNNLLKDNNIKK